jgi:peptide deformylase
MMIYVATYPIRTYGDPVLRQVTSDVQNIDESIIRLVEDMIETMHEAPGVGLAASQVGVQKRIFVYDIGEGASVVLNGRITESSGEFTYEEGCLSVPGLYWPITRPNHVLLEGLDLEGNGIQIEGSELLGRVFQHEIDHLDGVLLIERLDPAQYKQAMKTLRSRTLNPDQEGAKRKLLGGG